MNLRTLFSFAVLGVGLSSPLACSSDDGGGTTSGGYTLDNVCTQVVPKICASRKNCCDKATLAYDAAGCEAYEKTKCDKNVAEAKAGTMTFDGTKVDPCLAKLQPLLDKCYVSYEEISAFIADLKICQVFTGKVAVGGACERTEQCAPATGANEQVGCESNKCKLTKLLPEGAACSFASGVSEFCQSGTFCDADFTKMPPTGTCKKSLAVGDSCDMKLLGCGLGNYCDMTSKKCVAGKPEGAACASDIECKSLSCGAAKTCTKGDPMVDAQECNGK